MLLDESLENIMPSMLSPKRFIIEKQKQFNDKLIPVTDENIDECWSYAKQYNREEFIKYTVKSHYSMWYSINQSLLLKEMYAQENNFEYDCVILSRFDISPKNVIDFNSLDLSKLVSGYKELPRGEVNDWFMITNNINSNILTITNNINLENNLIFYLDYNKDNDNNEIIDIHIINEINPLWILSTMPLFLKNPNIDKYLSIYLKSIFINNNKKNYILNNIMYTLL